MTNFLKIAADIEKFAQDLEKTLNNKKAMHGKEMNYDHGHGVSSKEQNMAAEKELKSLVKPVDTVLKQEAERYQNQSSNATYYGDKNTKLHMASMKRDAAIKIQVDKIIKIAQYLENKGL